jgi:hypothetical protein
MKAVNSLLHGYDENEHKNPQLAISVYTKFKAAIQSGLAIIQWLMRKPHGLNKNQPLTSF